MQYAIYHPFKYVVNYELSNNQFVSLVVLFTSHNMLVHIITLTIHTPCNVLNY